MTTQMKVLDENILMYDSAHVVAERVSFVRLIWTETWWLKSINSFRN